MARRNPNKPLVRPLRRVFPLVRGDMSIERYLMHLLLAVIQKSNGQLRLSIDDLLAVDPEDRIVKSIDDKSRMVVLSCGPKYPDDTEVYEVRPQFEPKDQQRWQPSSPDRTNQLLSPRRPEVPRPLDTTEMPDAIEELPEMAQYLSGADNRIQNARAGMLDDVGLWLREQKIQGQREGIEQEREKPKQYRDGVLPFRTIKSGRPQQARR